MPGGFGVLDKLIEALTLVQTGKSVRMPIILVHRPFRRGLIDRFKSRLLERRMISSEDPDLFALVDEPDEVLETISRTIYERAGFEPTPAEQEIRLNLLGALCTHRMCASRYG